MKPHWPGYIALLVLGMAGIVNAIRLPTLSGGPYSAVVLPLYTNDSNDVIREKLKRSAAHATIEPSVVLPFMPPPASH